MYFNFHGWGRPPRTNSHVAYNNYAKSGPHKVSWQLFTVELPLVATTAVRMWEQTTTAAVSYTHLDVYKRQQTHSVYSFSI